ncbi:MAG: tubulin-like doman-containing protein [Planctomycetaceae bacterium]
MQTQAVHGTEVLTQQTENVAAPAIDPMLGTQLADYRLEEKLGAGGYGEVWRAIGPGGLPKAVKLLYGERNGQHAEAELKALERMRTLRHPFLLSIERIEVVNSRVIVVTELADRNLSQRFEECRRNSLTGIPRDELLGYLRDAADALDFMSEQHNLQHLDIKPDNLLLQGGHAKVADFGLAKDISVTNVSVLNGFTPMFAAPELFEGRPGRASDQYSLAIVYQMMLTGSSPFNGRTAAQLTAQHLRSQPDLTNLQPIDRPVIARALSKNMNSRFDNCRQFVDELSRRRHGRTNVLPFMENQPETEVPRTALLKTMSQDSVHPVQRQESVPVSFNAIKAPDASLRPSVFIGVGGLAGSVLRSLKNRIVAKSETGRCPFRMLQLDTDRETLTALKLAGNEIGLSADETLCIPLRTSNDYRSATGLDLSWLSRRWLFNIPRSGKVDGIRPLGRLALCDHRQAVDGRLQRILEDALTEDSRNDMSAIAEYPISSDGLDVYVVAATCGGTSSGTLPDIGLMVRNIARRRGLKNITIHGVLLHGTGAVRSVTDMQEANTVSVLRELRHLSTPGLGTPRGFEKSGVQADVAPFDDTSFVHVGDGLNDEAFLNRADDVAEYLVAASTTGAQLDFRDWREKSDDDIESVAQLRMLGMDFQDAGSLTTASREAGNLTSLLLRRWAGAVVCTGNEKQHSLPPELTDTQTLLHELNLTESTLPQQVMTLLKGETGQEIQAYADDITARLIEKYRQCDVTYGQVLDFMSQQLSHRDSAEETRTLHSIVTVVQNKLAAVTRNCHAAIDSHLHELLNSPHRLEGATAATRYTLSSLDATHLGCSGLLDRIETAFRDLSGQGGMDQTFDSDDDVRHFCQQYCVLLAYQTIHKCFVNHVVATTEFVNALEKRLCQLKTQVESVAADVASPELMSSSLPQPVVDAFDRYVRTSAKDCLTNLARIKVTPKEFASQLLLQATRFLMAAYTSSDDPASETEVDTQQFPQGAWPVYSKAGGRRRVLGLIPDNVDASEWKQNLQKEFGPCVAVRPVVGDNVSVVCEIEGVPIEAVLTRLTVSNPHIADVAARIHTRVDLEW